MCPARTPASILSVAPNSWKCQKTIAKAGEKFAKAKMKALSSCLLKNPAGTCPDTKALDKINGAVAKAEEKIADECGSDSVQAGLQTSYKNLADDSVITSCMLSQDNVTAELAVRNLTGVTTEDSLLAGIDNTARAQCIKELAKTGTKYVSKALKIADKCILKQMKDEVAGDLAPVCVGQYTGTTTAFTSPSDTKAADKQSDLVAKIEGKIDDKCGGLTMEEIQSIFGCPGATTVADLKECALCGGWDAVLDLLEAQYSEDGEYIANGPGVLQAAVGTGTAQAAANAGKKFLIAPGDYQEEVTIFEGGNDIAIVGCGGASDDRPRIIPPVTQVSGRGFQSSRVDGLRFQSLDFFDQDNDHIRVALAEGVSFRDITGDGDLNTAYAVFPVFSNNVLVELCKVKKQNDAPIYVGQSSTITVRYNDVREGVAGIEIENSSNANVHNNFSTGNTGGTLVFRDGSLPEDRSDCHDIHHNLYDDNNTPNFGSGTVAGVPRGTGLLVISNHTSPIHHNIARNNGSVGIALVDEVIAGFGPPFSPLQAFEDNYFFNNVMTDNGGNHDPVLWPLPPGQDVVFLTSESSGNCESGNIFTVQVGYGTFAQNSSPHFNLGTCTLPPPNPFPGCPGTPIDTDQ
jgi:parallel beta-helix repeat protein